MVAGSKKATSGWHTPEDIEALQVVPRLLETAALYDSRAPAEPETGVHQYHYFASAVRIGDRTYFVRIVVKKQTNGMRYYDHHAFERMVSPDANAGELTAEAATPTPRPSGPTTIRLGGLLGEGQSPSGSGEAKYSLFGRAAAQAGNTRAAKAVSWTQRLGQNLSPLGALPAKQRYLARRYLTLGEVAHAEDLGRKVYDTFKRAGDIQKKKIYEYLTTAGAPAPDVEQDLKNAAVDIKLKIERVGQALVDTGLMKQETFDAHRGEYLPRVYLKYLLPESFLRGVGGGKHASAMGYTLARDPSIPEDVRRLVLGEIKDPGFLAARGLATPLRDMAILDFLMDISQDTDWVFQDSVVKWEGKRASARWLSQEAQRIRKQAESLASEQDKKDARELAHKMDAIADPALAQMDQRPDDFREVPESKRYGRLAGMWVRKEIYDDLIGTMGMVGEESFAEKLLGTGGIAAKATGLWKMGKVALNPPAQVRNMVSNMVLLHLSGVPMWRIGPTLIQAAREMIDGDGAHYQIAKRYGVTKASFAANELIDIRDDLLDLQT